MHDYVWYGEMNNLVAGLRRTGYSVITNSALTLGNQYVIYILIEGLIEIKTISYDEQIAYNEALETLRRTVIDLGYWKSYPELLTNKQ